MTDQIPAEARAAVIDAVATALGDAYDCTRVWEAWAYGTMSQDDFTPVAERAEEIADAALEAALPLLRPEPSGDARAVRWVDDEKVMASVLEAWTGAWVDRRPSLLELILAAGFTRRPTPSREELAQVIDPAIYPDINRLTGDGWTASLRAADAVLALFKGDER